MIRKMIFMIIAGAIGIGGFVAVGQAVNTVDTGQLSSATSALVLPLFFCIMVIMVIFVGLGKDLPEERIDWVRYGERLKLAYAAKFGGENMGFNEEVDYKIKIMVNTDKGYTRQLAKDWIQRMSKFVELEWLKLDNANDEA